MTESRSPAPRAEAQDASLRPWHALSLEAVGEALDCTPEGLAEGEVARRQAAYGPNRLPTAPPPSPWRILLKQFLSPLIYVLMIAAGVSVAVGLYDDAVFIVAVLVINAAIGFVQEYRAERDIQSLGRLLKSRVRVVRAGQAREIDSEALVPGDRAMLESGMRVPADMRIIDSRGLRVDESLLTGESMPVEKQHHGGAVAGDTPLAERANMVFSGSTIFQGRGSALVVGTALDTEIGLIARSLAGEKVVKPPLLVRMERFTRVIGAAVLLLAVVVFGLGLLHGIDWIEILMAALALAVSAIPEGLPVALTVALAIGINRMAQRHVLVRHMESVEGLGSCSVIGTDKTGTLTKNQLTAVEARLAGQRLQATGVGYAPEGDVRRDGEPVRVERHALLDRLARIAGLCNEASLSHQDGDWSWVGDPTDIALLAFAHKAGHPQGPLEERYPRTNAIPFEPERRYAASFHQDVGPAGEERGLVVVKGAPERVFDFCERMWAGEAAEPVPFDRERALQWEAELVGEGLRVLALAERQEARPLDAAVTPEEPSGLTLVGLVGMTDPPRDGVSDSIAACHRAGIRVVMITGDHLQTARVIARRIGLSENHDEAIDCRELQKFSEEALADHVPRWRVMARATPQDKLRIVRAWQARGEFVAVTGDGVNDAPALRSANIGVAMGRSGTDIARDTAGLVITDDDFSSIVAGVEEGRAAYDNVRKVIYLLVSTGLGEVMLVMLAMLFGMPVPFVPAQLLWLNLVTNGIQDVALAFEPKEPGLLGRRPRDPQERIFNRIMIERTVLASLVFGGVSFAMFAWVLQNGYGLEAARNLTLNLFVLFEIFHIGNCRSEHRSAFGMSPLSNRFLILGTLGAMTVHGVALYWWPLQAVLRAGPLGVAEWQGLIGLAASILVVMEVHKALRRRWPAG